MVVACDGRRLVRVRQDNTRTELKFASPPVLEESGADRKKGGRKNAASATRTSALTSTGDRAVIIDSTGHRSVWDLDTGQAIHDLGYWGSDLEPGRGVTISSPHSTVVLPEEGRGAVRVFDLKSGKCTKDISCSPGQKLKSMAVSADGLRLVAADGSKQVSVIERSYALPPPHCVASACLFYLCFNSY